MLLLKDNSDTLMMKFRKSGIPDPNALDLMRRVQPLNLAKSSSWKRLDLLLSHVEKHKPAALSDYASNLDERYRNLTIFSRNPEYSFKIPTQIEDFEHLREFPILATSNFNYYLQVLQPPEKTDLEKDIVEVPQRNQLRAVLCPKYQNLLVLTQTIDRREAIEIYKEYHDIFARIGHSTQKNQYDTLEEFAARWNPDSDRENPGLIRFISDVIDGKLYLRKDNCLWNDAISDLEDSEIKYYICCYGDFDVPRRANSNFVLTMERTIIEGHPFCDSVFHDTRINNHLTHPPEEFFTNINPEK